MWSRPSCGTCSGSAGRYAAPPPRPPTPSWAAAGLGCVSRIVGEFGVGAGGAVEAGREPTIRDHRRRMGAAGTLAASDDATTGWALARPPPGPQRHLVPGAQRGAVAGPA